MMRRARFDSKARGFVCAIGRDNVIGETDQRTTSGARRCHDPHRQAEDMPAPTIKRSASRKPLISGHRPDGPDRLSTNEPAADESSFIDPAQRPGK